MDNKELIRKIEIRLKELGKTKGEFYEGAGITSASYSQWNTGEFSPSKRKLRAMAEYLDVPLAYLSGETDEKKPATPEGSGLSVEAMELVRLYDLASPELRAAALAVLKSAEAADKAQGSKAKEK